MLSHRTEVKSSAPSRAQRLAHTGDLFYQTVRPYQKNNYLFEKPDNNYVFSTGYAQMRPYVDGYFLLSLVQSERFVKVVLDNCTGTSYPAINANDLAEIEVAAPSDESEAQKIGTIFRSIDNLITLHQCKCQIDGCRFQSPLAITWEQRKLGNVAKFRQGIQVDLEKQYTEDADNRERFIRIVDYTQGTNDIRYIDKIDNANYVDEKDVVVVRYGATAGFIGRGIAGIVANNMFTINPSEELNKEFLYTYMKQDKMYNYLNLSNGSSAMPAINFGIMTSLNITYPSVAEQQKIGAYFSTLDHLITLHQCE